MKPQSVSPIPIPADASPVERWWLTVRGQTFKQLTLETALSLPVPMFPEGRLALAVFYYGVKRGAGPGKSHAMPPVARVSATYPEARLLLFAHCQAQELFPGLPVSGDLGPLAGVQAVPGDRYQQRRALFAAYGKIMELYHEKKGSRAERKAFAAAFTRVAEAPLLPFYRALNPDFFDWLEGK
jgi:hypothetical protein